MMEGYCRTFRLRNVSLLEEGRTNMVSRVYVEKKPGFDVEARQLSHELRHTLGIAGITGLRLLNRYDVEGISDELFAQCVPTVFSEPQSDNVLYDLPDFGQDLVFAVEYLPGQFDQRADSASECVQLISQGERPLVRSAKVYAIAGQLAPADVEAIKHYVINPVEAREASLEPRQTLKTVQPEPPMVEKLAGFLDLTDTQLQEFIDDRGLAMDLADIKFCQKYFAGEGRVPTITEIKMIDTYWSDHCRHTTFGTQLEQVKVDDQVVWDAFNQYLKMREELGRTKKPVCLMDMGTIGAKYLRAKGILKNLDESEEINACTIKCKVDVNGEQQDWLFLFKNETHNHPTEIEPFGGAATCIGGAIRDPLSGRSYVYQAMRVTGAGDPFTPVSQTMKGKLPQRQIVRTAAAGYSSYGNQIGLATGQVNELYHPGYVAKRMEIGAVVGATPADHVRRETPAPGDKIVLLGGRTGRDGIGGATGSSKAHNVESLEKDGAEVQKGNAPTERKLQRLFRRGDACRLIKRCNDFGAGGVSVAIGELADGLFIDLNRVPKKYEGLDGTELAISESQERMAVALAPEDVDEFIGYAHEENLEATVVARVTEEPRLRMVWDGETIVDISREFLASNGAPKHQIVRIEHQGEWKPEWEGNTFAQKMHSLVTDMNVASNKGLSERFDSTIGAATVLMPFGGRNQLTPSMAMVAKLPVEGETTTVSGMAWGFNPYLSSANQFTGAYLAVVESVAKLVAAGFRHEDMYLTFQEYFEKLRDEPERWGKPTAAVLGALMAQVDLGIGSIGGKDSMSGSFEDQGKEINVPPTLVSFAVDVADSADILSNECKEAGDVLLRFRIRKDGYDIPVYDDVIDLYRKITGLIRSGIARACYALDSYGIAPAAAKMAFGNGLGIAFSNELALKELFDNGLGDILMEVRKEDVEEILRMDVDAELVATVIGEPVFTYQEEAVPMADALSAWKAPLESVFPSVVTKSKENVAAPLYDAKEHGGVAVCTHRLGQPTVFIPVFPGTNCEYDSAKAFEKAGARTVVRVFRNITPEGIRESVDEFQRAIEGSQIIMFPGGFSAGDEPDGSAKFFAASFRNAKIQEAVTDLLEKRDGLCLGICNGFQALIKLGLVPNGKLTGQDENSPTLTFNTIGRHISKEAYLKVVSNKSPWLQEADLGGVYVNPASHGEGRFVAPDAWMEKLLANGQIATQYCDPDGMVTMDGEWNINGSFAAVEGITSPDGRVLGKMCHAERIGDHVAINIYGAQDLRIFESGVRYFS